MSFPCFDVAAGYFEEILLDFKKKQMKKKKKNCVRVNVCGAVRVPESRLESEWISNSSPAKVL